MKKIRTLRKAFGIVFGAVGASGAIASCTKERDCRCTYQYTYSDGTETYTGTYTYVVQDTLVKNCSELDQEASYSAGSYTYEVTVSCKKN